MIIKKNDTIIDSPFGEEIMLLNPENNNYHLLKGAAVYLWQSFESEVSFEKLVEIASGRFTEKEDVIKKDIEKLIADLEAKQLVEINK